MLDSVVVKLCGMRKRFRAVLSQAAVLGLLCASLTAFASTAVAQQGTFVPTGSLNTATSGQTATLLNNGKVLIVGGSGNLGASGTVPAELYDPAAGTFTPTGSMTHGRSGATATLLQNGMVLIFGGTDNCGTFCAQGTVDLYDPTTGTFSSTGILNINSADGATATLLDNGKVLVAGGDGSFKGSLTFCTNNAELYDPTTGMFTPT